MCCEPLLKPQKDKLHPSLRLQNYMKKKVFKTGMPFSFRAFWITTSSCKMRIQNTKEATVATNRSSSLIQKDKRRLCEKAMCLGLWHDYDAGWHDNKHQTKTLDTLLQKLVTCNICPRSGACSQHFQCILKLCPYRLRHLDVSQLRSTQPSASEIGLLKARHSPAELSATSGTATKSASAAKQHQAAHQCQVVKAPATWLSLIHQRCASLTPCCCVSAHLYIPISFPNRLEFSLNPWYQPQPVVQ